MLRAQRARPIGTGILGLAFLGALGFTAGCGGSDDGTVLASRTEAQDSQYKASEAHYNSIKKMPNKARSVRHH